MAMCGSIGQDRVIVVEASYDSEFQQNCSYLYEQGYHIEKCFIDSNFYKAILIKNEYEEEPK